MNRAPLHICFFNRSFYPDQGSTGQLLTELALDLVRGYGCSVSVVAGNPTILVDGMTFRRWRGWRLARREEYDGVEILRARGTAFPKKSIAGRGVNYISYFLSSFFAGFLVKRPNVIVSLTDPPIIGLVGLFLSWFFRARFVLLSQDVFPEVAIVLEKFRSRPVNWILDGINRFLLKRADGVVAIGETMKGRLVQRKGVGADKIHVIHNWGDCQLIYPGEKKNAFSLTHRLADRFVIMHAGNMGLSQGLDCIIEAARLLRDNPELMFVFIGNGVKEAELRAQVQEFGLQNVIFLPQHCKDELQDPYSSSDVFLVSLKRGLAGYIVPSKLYGILAAGRPFVAAVDDECEVAAIARKYDCGLVAQPEDPVDLAEKILTLYHNRAMARRLGTNARQAALEFDRRLQVGAYYHLLSQLNHVPRPRSGRRPPLLKRPFDLVISSMGLLLSVPFWGLIAAGIKLEDGGPVFYGQERVGKGGVRFKSWKFRSMIPDSDEKLALLQARDGDSRVTRVGRFLRATALDELPQLWNILRGDMSFVGPRALLPAEIEVNGSAELIPLERIPGYEARHQVSPGLTGLAQVHAPRDLLRRHKFKYDLLYIKRQTFWLDLRLLTLSFWITLRGKWGSREKHA